MIFYLVTPPHFYTLTAYFETWGKNVASQPRLLTYQDLTCARQLPAGTYIFSDIERMTPTRAEIATQVWETLSNSGEQVRLLNHPTRSMRRYELLRTLHEHGSNKFNIYRLTESRTSQSFPVFLRGENDHGGSLTPLLHTQAELDAAIRTVERRRRSRDNILIVEYCDTSDANGIFRKYGAFIVGDRIIPTHVFFSQGWLAKVESITEHISEEMLLEELQFVEGNPHEQSLREIARLARIDYGRIDYAVLDGNIQVWEINTNPHLPRLNFGGAARRPVLEYSTHHLNAAFESIDCHVSPDIHIRTPVDQAKLQRFLDCLHSVIPAKHRAYVQRRRKNLQKRLASLFR